MTIKYSEKHITNFFLEGDKLLSRRMYKQAIEKFLKVIELSENTSYPYLSGAYTNLAKATAEPNLENEVKRQEALGYIKKALQIKPTNQSAKSLAIPILVFQKSFSKAIDYFLELNIREAIEHSIPYLEMMQEPAIKGDPSIMEAIPSIEVLYQEYKGKYPGFGNILVYAYLSIDEIQKANRIYQEMLKEHLESPKTFLSICINYSLFCCGSLKNPKEAASILNKGISVYKDQKASFQTQNMQLYNFLISNLGMAYLGLNEYQKAVNLIEPLVAVDPRNTNLHNLAYAFYRLGDYEKALNYCERALFITSDDLTLFIKAEILYSKQLYKKALNTYKKSIALIESGKNYLEFVDGNKEMVYSFSFDQEEGSIKVYIGLIHCYVALKDYLSAKALVKLILKDFPFVDELVKISNSIDLLMEHRITEDEIQSKMQNLSNDLERQKEIYKKELTEVREWAMNLLKLQSRCVKNNKVILESEEDWRAILRQMHEIAVSMKELKNDSDFDYNQLKESFRKEFPNISDDSLDFLSTGEYLYQIHKDSEIDFAPVMVEYSKVIETELNQYLKKHKVIKKNQSLTLGQIKHNIQKVKIEVPPNLSEFLEQLVTFRNGSAHTGRSTRNKVTLIRNMILNDGWLKLILN